MKDNRYTITLLWCGYSVKKYQLEFCGDWLGTYSTKESALLSMHDHQLKRGLTV